MAIIEAFSYLSVSLFTMVCLIGLGISIGMYISSQIEKHIDKNIKK